MKENMQKVFDKIKEVGEKVKGIFSKIDTSKVKNAWSNLKDKLRKIGFLRAMVHFVRAHRLVISMTCFCITLLALILLAVLGLHEYTVPVCILMVIEVLMAVLLHRTELWIHGVLLVAQLIVAFAMARLPLVILCMLAYVAATITLQFAFERPEKEEKKATKKEEPKKEAEESESNDESESDENDEDDDEEEDDDDKEDEDDEVEDLNDPEDRHEESKSESGKKAKNKKKNKKKK